MTKPTASTTARTHTGTPLVKKVLKQQNEGKGGGDGDGEEKGEVAMTTTTPTPTKTTAKRIDAK